MEYRQQSVKTAQLNVEKSQHSLFKFKNKTLPQSGLQARIQVGKSQKDQTATDSFGNKKKLELKFNTSSENLRCFMPEPKPEKYRSVSTRLSKQSKSEGTLMCSRFYFRVKIEEKTAQTCKSQTSRSQNQEIEHKSLCEQSDLSTILSNEIIHSIQKKGIRYNWNDIEQIKSESFGSQNQDQLELEDLINTFSQNQPPKRRTLKVQSVHNSFIEANQVVPQGGQFVHENMQSNGYGYNMSYQQIFDSNYDKNYSFASTMQPYSFVGTMQSYQNMYYPMQIYHTMQSGLKSMPSSMFATNEFMISIQGLSYDSRTTIMIKNIPNKYTIQFLSDEIDQDFGNYYDFLYLPCDTKSGANQGYGFINFVDNDAIKRFYQRFHDKKWKRFRSDKICNLTYARLQGIDSLIEHFQNSKVLNHKEKKYQPIIKSLPQIHNLIKKQQTCQNERNGN